MLKTANETLSACRRRSAQYDMRASPGYDVPQDKRIEAEVESASGDEFGPAAPKHVASRLTGPTMPRMDDIALRDQMREEDGARDSLHYRDDIRYQRRQDRKAHKELLEELVPRPDPGSRERKLEKKRETTSVLKGLGDAKENGQVEIGDADLMGDDGIDAYKRSKTELERKKNEREIRREEIMRARAAEREERLAEIRQKEAATMEYLKAIARDRFG
jgi:hypothetical protein